MIRLRTNYRKGEDVYLYRTTISPAQAHARFLEYIRSLNDLREKPHWYNAHYHQLHDEYSHPAST